MGSTEDRWEKSSLGSIGLSWEIWANQYPGRTLVSLWQAHLPEFLFAVRWLNENIQIREDGAVRFDEGMWIEKLISPPKPTLGQIYQ